jgi:peptide/nickel transport system substrate-binding protein
MSKLALSIVVALGLSAVDVEQFMSAIGDRELWELCPAVYHCGKPWESRAGEELYNQKNPEKARQLLKEAGAEGATIKIMNPTDYATIGPLGHVLKPMLENIGLKVEMPGMDWATLISKIYGNDYNIFTTWYSFFGTNDPIGDAMAGGTQGFGGNFADPKMQELRKKWATSLDLAERKRYVDEIQRLHYENVPRVFLGRFANIYPHRSWVKNFTVPAYPLYMNVWIEK